MKNICPHFYSYRGKTQCCHVLEGLEVQAGCNLRSEAFFHTQMNLVWSVEFICLDVFLKKWHFSAPRPTASEELHQVMKAKNLFGFSMPSLLECRQYG